MLKNNPLNSTLDSYQPGADLDGFVLQNKCPVCENQEFEWGTLAMVYYVPGPLSYWKMPRGGRQVIKVRRCLRCNNLMQFTDPELSRKQARMVTLIVLVAILVSVILGFGGILLAASVPR